MNLNLNEKLNKALTIKNVSLASIILNLASIALGIIYLITIYWYNFLWDVLGVVLIITWFMNLLLMFRNSVKLNKDTPVGGKINLLCYIYVVYSIIAVLSIMGGNCLISITYSNDLLMNLGSYLLIYLNYFGLLGFGLVIAFYDFKNLNNREIWDVSQAVGRKRSIAHLKTKKVLKIILKVLCYLTLANGIYVAYITLFGFSDYVSGLIGVAIGQFDLFYSFLFLSTTILLLKIKDKKVNPKGYKAVAIIGLSITGILVIPICFAPYNMITAEQSFSGAFPGWKSKVAPVEGYFLSTPFSTPEYILGMPPKPCIVKEHISFYNGTGEYTGITLFFDAYLPPNRGQGLPGQNSTIIRIHGGGWVFGDKGWGDMMQMNKYFAAQGYVVFDIQYALNDFALLSWEPLTPKYRKGDFNMDQIVTSLGFFTKYIAINHQKYGANLSSTFVSGGSAGGQLTCALGLGIASGQYTTIFGSAISIKGIIPFYPGNGVSEQLGITGIPQFVNPTTLVNLASPPCLIYQGTHDGLVPISTSQTLRNTYIGIGNTECALILMPFSGHANDIYFSGHFNQIFLYYMERFLYINR